jgi:hypothetical protein
MSCPRCSSDVPEGNSFCPGCGLRIRPAGPQQPPDAPTPPQYAPPSTPVAPPIAGYPPSPQAPGEVYFTPPPGPEGTQPAYQSPQQYYPPQGPPGVPPYPSGGGPSVARPMDRNSLIQIIAIVYVGLYFLISSAVVLSNSSGAAATVLGVAAIIGVFAAVALPGYVLIERGEYDPLGQCVMIAAAAAAFLLLILIFVHNAGFAKFSAIIAGIAIIGAQTALLLLMKANKKWFKYVQYAAIGIGWLAGVVLAITLLRVTSASTFSGSITGLAALGKASSICLTMDTCASVIAILVWRLALKYGG